VLVVFARHAHSQLNLEHRINGDPSVPVHITADGQDEAHELGLQLANVQIELCVHTRFCRTEETAELALAGRNVPVEVEPLLDDIDIGDLEGETVDEYHAWKAKHVRSDPFPGGESLDDAAKRYAQALRKLAARDVACMLVVCHEIPIRYALNAASGSDSFDGPVHAIPNASPFLFDEHSLVRAADGIDRLLSVTS
jgi:broad specificity phosphatase PhoE